MEEIDERKQYLNVVVNDKTKLLGIIYLITNLKNNKQYVGQTMSHRMNSGKYKPFGEIARFKHHVSEAINNTKKKQCCYLNNAIRKYSQDAFKVEVIEYCLPDDANDLEIKYIRDFNTLCPNGYNLAEGGRKGPTLLPQKVKLMTRTHEQFFAQKLEKFKAKKIDVTNLDQYIHECNYARFGGKYFIVKVDDVKSIFVAQHLPLEELRKHVYEFLKLAASHAT